MSDTETSSNKTESRRGLYAYASKHSREAIDKLVELLHCHNPNVALGAAKALLDKALPDLKAVELSGQDGRPVISIRIIDDKPDTTEDQELSRPADDISIESTVQDST